MMKNRILKQAGIDALEDLPVIIAVHDKENHILWANTCYREATGLTLPQIEDNKCYTVWQLNQPCRNCPVIKAIETGEVAEAKLTPQNQAHWPESQGAWSSKAQPIRDDEGKIIGAIEIAYDITEQWRREEALRESEARLAETQRIAHIGYWEVDLTSGEVTWSDELYRIMQVDPDAQLDLDTAMREFTHPDDRVLAQKAVQEAMATGEVPPFEFRAITGEGEERVLWSKGKVIRNAHDEPVRFVGVNQDVTERRRAEESLRETEASNRAILGAMPDMMFRLSRDGTHLDFHATDPQQLYVPPDHIIGRTVGDLLPPDVAGEYIRRIGRTFAHHATEIFEYQLGFPDGARYFEARMVLCGDDSVLTIVRDITERKQAEEARQRVLTLLEKAEKIGMSGSWSQDVRTGLEEWSQGEYDIHGLAQDVSPCHERHLQCVHPEDRDRHDKLFKEHLASDRTHCTQEYRIQREDGKIRHIEANYQIVRDDAGRPLSAHGTDKDTTERKLLEEQLRHATKMEAVGQLASGVAHEFNNLLFGILGSAELILATLEGDLPAHVDRPLRDIKKCGRRGAALTKQLLSFARKKTPEISQFDINQVISDLDTVLQQVSGERIALEVDLALDLRPVEADRGDVEQAIMNLARNARDAMPDGGALTICTAAEQLDEARLTTNPLAHPGLYVRLSVTDTGCGMTPETVERVFEPFFTTKPVGKGTGLGLSTVFADVTKNRGIIEVDSRQGEGTEFRIFLPAADEKSGPTSDDTEVLADQLPGGNETILVVDDDQVVLDSAAFLLEIRGYSVMRACGGREAIEAAASHTGAIELLLTDVTMPGINGWELAQELTGKRPDTKVIFMSGYAEDVLKAGAAEAEHIEFLQKPPETEALFRRIREVLDAPGRPAP